MKRLLGLLLVFALPLFTPRVHAVEPILEDTEWTDIWIANAPKKDLPRVLLVGDSIARAYYDGVDAALKGRAHCARYATSMFVSNPDFLAELSILLDRYPFEVIHINNGLHGYGYTEAQYREGLEQLLKLLQAKAPKAKLIWCQTTPFRDRADLAKLSSDNTRVIARNQIAAEVMKAHSIPLNDLYAAVQSHPEYTEPDGVHFNAAGQRAQAEAVAKAIAPLLPTQK